MKLSLTATLLTTLALCACRSKPTQVVIETPAPASAVVVQQDHSGHYLYNGVWYSDPQHLHVVKGN